MKKRKISSVNAEKSFDDFVAELSEEDEANSNEGDVSCLSGDGGSCSANEDDSTDFKSQKKYLASLEKDDPSFYEFLKEHDEELLNFDESSSEEEGECEDRETDQKPVHVLPTSLEVPSDESDFEDVEDDRENKNIEANLITKDMLDEWANALTSKTKVPNITDISQVVQAFQSTVASVRLTVVAKNKKSADKNPETGKPMKYRVFGSTIFNGVIRLCILHLDLAFRRYLRIQVVSTNNTNEVSIMQRSKWWSKLNRWLKMYTIDLISLIEILTNELAVNAILKHLHSISSFYSALPKSRKLLLRCLIKLWSSAEMQTPRILSFLCIIKIVRADMEAMFEVTAKQLYLAYVQNCKFTSPRTWPAISFMRRSLAELFNLDPAMIYQHAFIYIRQLAIHLRNAVTLKKKDSIQTVYNWQFVHSVHLWVEVIGLCSKGSVDSIGDLEPLLYPLVQVIVGCIKLVYTPKFYPLRFHCCDLLTELCLKTGRFVPVLPYYLDILETPSHKKSKVSMKPMDFSCILKLSKSQLIESSFKDAALEHVYSGILKNLSVYSHKIGFPELSLIALLQMKSYIKKCKVANYCRKIKCLIEKIQQNSTFIENKRRNVDFQVGDTKSVEIWETKIKAEGTPLYTFYESWRKVHDHQEQKVKAEQLKLDDYSFIPNVMKRSKPVADKKKNFTSDLLMSDEDEGDQGDSDEEPNDFERFLVKEERTNTAQKSLKSVNEKKKKRKLKNKKSTSASNNNEGITDPEEEEDKIEELCLNDLDSF